MTVQIGITSESNMPYYNNCIKKFGWNSWKQCPIAGSSVEILRELLRKMNQSVELIESSKEFGVKLNRSAWTGILGSIMNEEFDTSIFTYLPIQERLESFDMSTSVEFKPYAFFYKLSDDSIETYATSLFKPFSRILWALIFTVIGISNCCLALDIN